MAVRAPRFQSGLSDPGPTWWEQAICIGIIAMLTGALIGPVFAPTQEETPVLRLIWLPVYAAIAGMILFRLDRMWRVWPAAIAVLVLVAITYASSFWSIDAETTERRSIALAISGAFALYLGAVFRGAHLPRLLMHAGLIMAVGSLVMVFAFPAIGIHQADNAGLWRGLWYEKNQMGAVMVIAATASAACLASPDDRRLLPFIALGLTSLLVLVTQSKTSLLCLSIGLGIVGGFWAMKRGGAVFSIAAVWGGVVAAALGYMIWSSHSVEILELLGKDPSLTGRTEIWAALMRRVAERPWTGFGYGAFWGRDSVPADWIRLETGWLVPNAHHGWIDLLIQVGWPGTIIVGVMMGTTVLIGLIRSNTAGAEEGWWALAFMVAFLVLSLSESVLLAHQGLPWVLFMAAMTRAVLPDPQALQAPLAARPRRAYQTAPRIAPDYAHGPSRRPFPV